MGKPLSALILEIILKVSLGPWPPEGLKEHVMSKTGWILLLWPKSCLTNHTSVFMITKKSSQKLLKVKQNMTNFWHNIHPEKFDPYNPDKT